jgi:DNA-binding LacI/PurR family transcriptional regulator
MADQAELQRTVRELVQQRIFRGEWVEGYRIDEEALREETSATVRAVRSALQELTESGLLNRKQRLGTFVARKQKTGASPRTLSKIGIITSLLEKNLKDHPYFTPLQSGIRQLLAPKAEVVLHSHAGQEGKGIYSMPPLQYATLREEFPGLISIEVNNLTALNQLVSENIPLVSIDFAPPNAHFDSVCVDHERAGYLATEHLLSLGHKTIAFMGEYPNYKKSRQPFQNWWLDVARTDSHVLQRMPEFHRRVQPTAYVLCSSSLLANTIKVLGELGQQCPRDVSLVCVDGIIPNLNSLTVSHVQVEYEELGRLAMRLLMARMVNPGMPPVKSTLDVDFKPGDSSRVL